jgi:flagellar hook-associated protein 2
VGSYSISVTQLASAQQLVSKAFKGDGSTIVGTGTLKVSVGATSFNVTIDGAHSTVGGIANAINSAVGNSGVTASVVNGTDGAHIILSSAQTGATGAIKVEETDAGTALSAVTYVGTTNTANYTETSPAQDAIFTVSGIPHTSSSNTVTDALNGVTLTLTGTTASGTGPGSSAQLTVSNDTSTITSNIQAFVDSYNTMLKAIKPLGSYDQTTNTAGPMLGDSVLTGIQNEIRSALHSVVNTGSSTYSSLASVGITTKSDGSLSLDTTKLQTALATAPAAVSSLFSSANGVAANLNTRINQELGSGGIIETRSKTLINKENALTQQTNDLNDQMTKMTASLTLQYAQLNTLLSQLQTTSAYLTQQFAALPQVQQKG